MLLATPASNLIGEKMKIINLFGGPGCGKSTTRAGLFSLMKINRINCEEVTEYAKDAVWDNSKDILADQLFVLANQNRRLFRLQNKVEWAISDSPLLLSIHYRTPDYLPKTLESLIWELWDQYENYNFFLERTKPYSGIGRLQTESEAKAIDLEIKRLLDENEVPFVSIPGNELAPQIILDTIFGVKANAG